MATGNFKTQKDFKLVVGEFAYYDEDEGEDFFYQDEYDTVEEELNTINETLEFYELTLEAGYYEGAQVYVKESDNLYNCDPLNYDESNENTHYWHGYNKSTTKRKIQAEQNRINTILRVLTTHTHSKRLPSYEITF